MRVHCIESLAELDQIESAWVELEGADPAATIFQSWVWNRTWCEHSLSQNPRLSLGVYVFEDSSGRVQSIVPTYSYPLTALGARVATLIGHKSTCHNDILMRERSSELAADVVALLREQLRFACFCHMRYLVESSEFTRRLIELDLAEPQCTTVFLAADEEIADQYSRLGGKRRKVLRSNERRLRSQHDVDIVYHTGDRVAGAFDALMRLHAGRIDALGKSSVVTGANYEFLREVTVRLAALEKTEIVTLCVDDEPIAAELYLRDGDYHFGIQSGFDMRFSKFSPLRMLSANVVQKGFDEGRFRFYDMGPATETHKFDWRPRVSVSYFACLGGPGMVSSALSRGYCLAFRRSLPEAFLGRERVKLKDLNAALPRYRGG